MARETTHPLANYLHRLVSAGRIENLSDGELVEFFVSQRDEDAFAALVRRHGPMVLRVCQRVLYDAQTIEDVFQATFLVLSRKAASLRCAASVSCWLHGVAHRLAQNARRQCARRLRHETEAASERHAVDPLAELSVREAQMIVDEELARLPEKFRAPLVLCCLEGRTRDEAARQLGWPIKLVKSRLEQGRERLRSRLSRRGLTVSAALIVSLLAEEAAPAIPPAALVHAALQAARTWPGNGVSSPVALLAETALGGMATVKTKIILGLLLFTGLLAAGVGAFAPWQPAARKTEAPSTAKTSENSEVEKQSLTRTDRYGDPLPSGALARLGTLRWRHGNQVTAVAFSPDGTILAFASWDGAIHLGDAKTGKLLRILRDHEGFIASVFFTPDGKQLVSCGGTRGANTARVWDVATGKELRRWPIPGGWKLALSPDGKLLAGVGVSGLKQNSIVLWDIGTGKQIRELLFEGVQDSVTDLAFSPDGKRLVSGGGSTLRLFDVINGKQLRTFGAGKRIYSVAFSSDGKTVAVGRWEEPLTLWDVSEFKEPRSLGELKGIARVAFSHDGKILASCGFGFKKISLWDMATGKKLHELPGKIIQVWDMAFAPDDKILAVGNLNSQVRLWEVATGKELSSVGDYRGFVNVLAFLDRGQGIASVSDEGKVCHWNIATSKVLRKFQEDGTQCYCGDLSPDKRTLALGDGEGVHLFDWSTGKKLRLLKGHTHQVWSAVFSPKGDVLASSANMDQHIILWDVAARKELRRILTAYLHDLRSLAWSPNGKVLASAGAKVENSRLSDTVCLWNPSTGALIRQWRLRERQDRQTSGLLRLAFSPDGMLLAAGDGDHTIGVWDVATGRMRARFAGHRNGIMALAFAPNGLMLASGSGDRAVRLWELSTWKERRCYEGHLGTITKLAFSADGQSLASASGDSSVLLWSVVDGDPLKQQPELVLSPRQLEKLWDDLASPDAARAWGAVGALVKSPKQSIPWLKQNLKPLSAAQRDRIEHLIADLDSDQFAVRQRAAQELEKLVEQAEPALRKALENRPSLEVRRRINQLLERLEAPVQSAAVLRELRSIEVLEYIGTTEAQGIIRSVAERTPESRLTREAKAALERLTHRSKTAR